MYLVDSHCHLHLLNQEDGTTNVPEVIKRAEANDVKHILNVCVAVSEFPQLITLANQYSNISTSVGLHPNDKDEQVDLDQLLTLGKVSKVVAIGETGLDYYRSEGDLDWQRNRFRTHIIAAKMLNKPLIIHTRDAKNDTLHIMREENASHVGGVMHCFSEDWDMAKEALDMDFYISFSGIVTFKSALVMQEVARKVPLSRILVETDAPYLAPVPYRGKPNEPAYVKYTAAYIAELRGMPLETFAEITTANFFNLFKGAKQNYV